MIVEKINYKRKHKNERGAALAIAIIVLAIMAVIALTALAFSSTEARIAGSDLQRTQTFYATTSAMEKMTNDFSNLFRVKRTPTAADLFTISHTYPQPLIDEGFTFDQTLAEDTDRLAEMRRTQNLPSTVYPRVNIPDGPYAGLYSTIIPYKLSSTGKMVTSRTEVKLEREFNNYLVPLFQFGIFSNEDLEFSPGPLMTFNGRVHTNRNLYAMRNIKFLNRVSMAGELVRNATRSGDANTAAGNTNVFFEVNGVSVQSTQGSVLAGGGTVGGPNVVGTTAGQRGYFPGSPNGVFNSTWESESVKPADGTENRFGGQVLTNTTGAAELKTPLELAGNSPAEIIKRSLPSDDDILTSSRYHGKSQVRILIDDEGAGSGATNVAGISAGGVLLSDFVPSVLNSGNALRPISDGGTVGGSVVYQRNPGTYSNIAGTVRATGANSGNTGGFYYPRGAGLYGKILIQIVKPDGSTVDVTQQILSMGVTEGEPNGIVYLQRPLWAAFVQGSRDRSGRGFDLISLTNSQTVADGEIVDPLAAGSYDSTRGFITFANINAADEDAADGKIMRDNIPNGFNQVVPINIYNVREGWVRNSLPFTNLYPERGITSAVELNMRNLAKWLDGVYDSNLLAGTSAVSTNIKGDEGYVVYISDRRGDKIHTEYLSNGTAYNSTNGSVDNEDIYGPNNILDPGEDVIDFGWNASAASKKGTLQKDVSELPDNSTATAALPNPTNPSLNDRYNRAKPVLINQNNLFRRSVRLFNGENLSISGAVGKLSPNKGITIASENMVYIWGNFNTSGVTGIPINNSTLNNGGFMGAQVPSSIVCDAVFPLSKTWYDGLSAMFPEGTTDPTNTSARGFPWRMADDNLPSVQDSTAVRAGIIAGTTLSSLRAGAGEPGRNAAGLRNSGGIINYPRFLEQWNSGTEQPWSYSGSLIPLFHSTQAISQWEQDTSVIYLPPRRNWSFDQTFLDPTRLPPGTPFFQYVQATGFRQVLR